MEKGTTTGDAVARGVKPNADVQSAVAQLWEIIRNAGELLVAVREDNNSLAARLQQAREQVEENRTAIAGIGDEREHFRAQLATRDEEIAVLRSALAEAEKNVAGRDGSLAEQSDRLERYEETIRRLTAELDTRNSTVEELQGRLAEHHDAQEELERMRSEAGTLNATIIELRGKLTATTTAAKDAEYLRAELVRRNTELNARIKEAMQYRERTAELESKLFEHKKMQADFAETRRQLETLQEELQNGTEAEQRAQQYEGECRELRLRLEESRAMEAELLARIQQLHDDGDVHRHIAEEQQKHVVELSGQVLQLKAVTPRYEEQIDGLNARILALEEQLRDARGTLEARELTLRSAKEAAEQALLSHRQEHEQLEARYEALQEELRDISQGTITRDFIEEKQVLVSELRTKLQEKEQEAEKLRIQLDAAYTSGSLFTAGAPAADAEERDTVIAAVQDLLKKVEHALEEKEQE